MGLRSTRIKKFFPRKIILPWDLSNFINFKVLHHKFHQLGVFFPPGNYLSFLITLFSLKLNINLNVSPENLFQKPTSSTSNRPQEKREAKDQFSAAQEISYSRKTEAITPKEENYQDQFPSSWESSSCLLTE